MRSPLLPLAALLFACCSGPGTLEVVPPDGYRAIAESEYSGDWLESAHPYDWLEFAERFPTPDRAEGDFDGDGTLDCARTWIREVGEGWAESEGTTYVWNPVTKAFDPIDMY